MAEPAKVCVMPKSVRSESLSPLVVVVEDMGVQSRRDSTDDTVTITKDGRWYVAKDESSGVASQGETKAEALENLADALALHARPEPEDAVDEIEPSTAPWL